MPLFLFNCSYNCSLAEANECQNIKVSEHNQTVINHRRVRNTMYETAHAHLHDVRGRNALDYVGSLPLANYRSEG